MILRRHRRHFKLTRKTPSVPPPLPLQLNFADLLSEDDDGEWETVREDELSPLEEPVVSSAETPFPLVTCLHAGEEPGAALSEWPDSIPACTVAPGRSWLRYAAVVAAASLAVAAALLPIRWPWLAAPMIRSAASAAQAGRVEPVTYVVPITVVGQAPTLAHAAAQSQGDRDTE